MWQFLQCGACGGGQAKRIAEAEAQEMQPLNNHPMYNHPQDRFRPPNNHPMGVNLALHENRLLDEERDMKFAPVTCTDICCAALWFLSIAGVGVILLNAHDRADIRRLYHGIDWSGDVCGLGDMTDKPFLYWCTEGGLVMTAQEINDMTSLPPSNSSHPSTSAKPTVSGNSSAASAAHSATTSLPPHTIDASHVQPAQRQALDVAVAEPRTLAYPPADFIGRQLSETKSSGGLPSHFSDDNDEPLKATKKLQLLYPICMEKCPSGGSTKNQCLQKETSMTSNESETGSFYEMTSFHFQFVQDYQTRTLGHMYCLPEEPDMVEQLEGKFAWGVQAMLFHLAQVQQYRWHILAAVLLAMVLGYSYLILSKCFAGPVIYVSIIMSALFPIAAGIYMIFGDIVRDEAKAHHYHGEMTVFTTGNEQWDEAIAAGLILFGLIILCLACYMHTKIQLTLATIDATVTCIWDTPAMLIHPLWMVIPRLMCVVAACSGCAYLLTVGEVQHMESTSLVPRGLARTFELTFLDKLSLGFYCFVAVWIIEVIQAFDEFVFGYAAQRWYSKPLDPSGHKNMSLCVIARGYFIGWMHVGSLAYGALILTVFRPITNVMSLVYSRVSDSDDNAAVARCMAAGCCCCMQLWEKFLRYLSRDAYLVVAVQSVGFCEAAEQAVNVLLNESAAARAVHGATRLFQVGGLISITGGCTALTWFMCVNNQRFSEPTPDDYVSSPVFVTVLAGIFSFLVAMCFTMIFGIVANTLLFCWALDGGRSNMSINRRLPQKFEELLARTEPRLSNEANNRDYSPGNQSPHGNMHSPRDGDLRTMQRTGEPYTNSKMAPQRGRVR